MKVLVYPQATNPYQKLLEEALRRLDPSIDIKHSQYHKYLGGLPFIASLPSWRLRGFRILHVHWPEFRVSRHLPYSQRVSDAVFVFALAAMRILRFKVVWTVHNVLPHERHTSDDARAARLLARVADVKIVHSPAVVARMQSEGIPTAGVRLAPHGSYIGVYPHSEQPRDVRREVRVRPSDTLFLFFGLMRPYKGLDDLLEAFRRLDDANVSLLLAGRCTDSELLERLRDAQAEGVVRIEGHIPNEDVEPIFDAADVVCLPFKDVTTTGSALLALSFATPIVAPRLGALKDLPEDVGYFYEPREEDGLLRALRRARDDKDRSSRSARASSYARSLKWSQTAKVVLDTYRELQ